MVIVNKILNVLIFLLAIAACVAAIFLHQRRQELRGRADYLANIVLSVAENIDGDEANSSEINSTQGDNAITKESLTWQSYHKERELNDKEEYVFTKWEDRVKVLPGQTESLFTLKVNMATKFAEIREAIKLDLGTVAKNEDGSAISADDYLQSLNSTISFSDMVAPIPAKIVRVTERGNLLATNVEIIFKNLKGSPEEGAFNIFADDDVEIVDGKESFPKLEASLRAISDKASALYSRSQTLAKGYETIIKAFDANDEAKLPQFYKPKFNPADVLNEDQGIINAAVATLQKDLLAVNNMLHERVVVKEQLAKSRIEIDRKDTTIAELNDVNDKLKNNIGKVKATNARISKQLAELIEITGKDRAIMRPGFAAQVLEANDRFDFIILNKGKKDGVKNNVEMVVHSNGKYICKVLVTKVLEDSCVCDILPITRPKDAKGNYVLPATGDEAVVPGQ